MATISLKDYLARLDALLRDGTSDPDEIIHHCRHILQYYPRNVAAYRYMGRALMTNAHWEQAAEVYRRVLSVMPDDVTAHAQLGEIYHHTNQFDHAIWHYERAFEADPNVDAVVNALRELYQRHLGVTSPKIQLTAGGLARQYSRNGLPDRAIATLQDALQQTPNRSDLRLLLAQTLWDAGYRVEAAETSMDVLQTLPDCLEANHILTRLWLDEGRPSDAQRFLNRVEAVDPYMALGLVQAGVIPNDAFQLEELDYQQVAQREMVSGDLPWLQQIEEDSPESETEPAADEASIIDEDDDTWMDVLGDEAALIDEAQAVDDLADIADIDEPDWMDDIEDMQEMSSASTAVRMSPVHDEDVSDTDAADELPDSDWLAGFEDGGEAVALDDDPLAQDVLDEFMQQDVSGSDDLPDFDLPDELTADDDSLAWLDSPDELSAGDVGADVADEDDGLQWLDTADDVPLEDAGAEMPDEDNLAWMADEQAVADVVPDIPQDASDDDMAWMTSGDDAPVEAAAHQDFSPHDSEDPLAWASGNIEFVEDADNMARRGPTIEAEDELSFEIPDEADSLAWLHESGGALAETDSPLDDVSINESDDGARDPLAWMQNAEVDTADDSQMLTDDESVIDEVLPTPPMMDEQPSSDQESVDEDIIEDHVDDYFSVDDALDIMELAEAGEVEALAFDPTPDDAPAEGEYEALSYDSVQEDTPDDDIDDDEEFIDDAVIEALATGEMAPIPMGAAEDVDDAPDDMPIADLSQWNEQPVEDSAVAVDDDYDWLDDGVGDDTGGFSPLAEATVDEADDYSQDEPNDIVADVESDDDWMASADDDLTDEVVAQVESDDDWMTTATDVEAHESMDEIESDDALPDEVVAQVESDDDWMTHLSDDQADESADEIESEDALPDAVAAQVEPDDDWMTDLSDDQADESADEIESDDALPDAIAAQVEPDDDWVAAISENDDEPDIAVETTMDDMSDDDSLDWLDEITDATGDLDAETDDAGIAMTPEDEAVMSFDALVSDDDEDADAPDDFDWGEGEEVEASITDRPAWLDELEAETDDDDIAVDSESEVEARPDWLSEIESDTGEFEDDDDESQTDDLQLVSSDTQMLTDDDADGDPGWLSELTGELSRDVDPDDYAPDAVASTDDMMSDEDDWLSDITTGIEESVVASMVDDGDDGDDDGNWLPDGDDDGIEQDAVTSVEEALDWMSDEVTVGEQDPPDEMVDDEDTSLTPAENAPDWLNAMVPGLDLDYEAGEDAPIEQEYVAEAAAESSINLLDEGEPPQGSTEEFDWLLQVVDEETGPMAPVDAGAKQYRFSFKQDPVWLQEARRHADPPAPPATSSVIRPLSTASSSEAELDDELDFGDLDFEDDDLDFDDFDFEDDVPQPTAGTGSADGDPIDTFTDLDDLPDWLRDIDASSVEDDASDAVEDDFDVADDNDVDLPDWLQ